SGILPPEAPGTPDQVSGRVGYPGIPTRTSPAMSAPALGGPATSTDADFNPWELGRRPGFIGPRWGGGPPPGFSMDDAPSAGGGGGGGGSYWDPRNWFKADPNATFEPGK